MTWATLRRIKSTKLKTTLEDARQCRCAENHCDIPIADKLKGVWIEEYTCIGNRMWIRENRQLLDDTAIAKQKHWCVQKLQQQCNLMFNGDSRYMHLR